jgi:2-polyprenyl-6-methoxyphenol hydroxylase-like FAD-dependent oxidoreductase
MVSVGGYLGDHPEPSHDAMVAFAKEMPASDLHDIMAASEPLAEAVPYNFPHSQRRIYEELTRHPEGVLAFGDAICSFNPIFGQGMSVAALEAKELADCLALGTGAGLWRRFYRKIKPIIDVPWSITVGNDLQYSEVEGKRSLGSSFLNGYLARLLAAAAKDPVVGSAFMRVTHLLDPPTALFAPNIVMRTMRGGAIRKTATT